MRLFEKQPAEETKQRIDAWINHSRRSNDTWLVTEGYVLKPPFDLDFSVVEGEANGCAHCLDVIITGSNGTTLRVQCNEAITSPYREVLTLALIDNSGVLQHFVTLAPFTRSKQLLLEAFPPGSEFSSEELYANVTRRDGRSQSHARRRWKELKYEFGFDVDFDPSRGVYVRGNSEVPVRQPEIRPDDNRLKRDFWNQLAQLDTNHDGTNVASCNYCGTEVIPFTESSTVAQEDLLGHNHFEETEANIVELSLEKGLIDHRRPVFQGGTDDLSNLQIFCQTCNNKKNSACRACTRGYRCETCVWAYPERHKDSRVVLHLSADAVAKLRSKYGSDFEEVIAVHISNLLTD